jgi:L-lactate dehydrogenase complex protein LldG
MVEEPVNTAREAILAGVRAALADVRATGSTRPSAPTATARRVDQDLLELLIDRVADYRASVVTAPRDGVAPAVAAALDRHRARRIVVPADLPRDWRPADFELIEDRPPLAADALDAVDGVLTGAALAIAETGTVVLDSGSGQGRRALTLLPDLHVCVVDGERVVASVQEGIDRLAPRRPITFISGPSATSDIELARVEGVHGPRRLEVIVIDRSAS